MNNRLLRQSVGWLHQHIGILVVASIVGALLGVSYYCLCSHTYSATATLLVLQAENKPLRVTNEIDSVRNERDDYAATQSGIIGSPLIMQRAIDTVGLEACPTIARKSEPVTAALSQLRVTRPDRNAKILLLDYRAHSRAEAVLVLDAIVTSYINYVSHDLLADAHHRIAALIESKQGGLNAELVAAEAEYAKFRRAHPGLALARQGHSANAERLLRWGVAINDTELRQIRVSLQLSLAKQLTSDGVKNWGVAYAIGQLGDSGELLRSIDMRESSAAGGNDYLRTLLTEQQRVTDEVGAGSSRAAVLQERIQALQKQALPAASAEARDILASMCGASSKLSEMHDRLVVNYNADLKVFNDDEVAMLEEDRLRDRMERARTLLHTLLDNLKQAQLNSEYNAITASILETPHASARAVSPRLYHTILMGVLLANLLYVVISQSSTLMTLLRHPLGAQL